MTDRLADHYSADAEPAEEVDAPCEGAAEQPSDRRKKERPVKNAEQSASPELLYYFSPKS